MVLGGRGKAGERLTDAGENAYPDKQLMRRPDESGGAYIMYVFMFFLICTYSLLFSI